MTNLLLKNRLRCTVVGVVLCFGLAGAVKSQVATAPTPVPLNDASPKGRLAVFQDFIQYPPESRPLHTSNWDLLHPWTVDTPTLPLTPESWTTQLHSLLSSGTSKSEIAQKIVMPSTFPTYHFQVNKLMLAGTQDELIASMTIFPPLDSSALPPIHIVKAELIGDANFGYPNLGSVPYSCETGPNPVCTFRWKAPAAEKQYWGALKLRVTVSLDGKGDDYIAVQHFYSSSIVAGRFTGAFQERLVDGSLLIDAGVSVQKRMACSVSANLFSVDKEMPTHHAERRIIVDPSMKTITFTFFGKIFRDYGHEGAFRLQDLKAQCENAPYPPEWITDSGTHLADLEGLWNSPHTTSEPTRIYFEYNNVTYTTKSYSGTAFSNKAWVASDGAQKKLAVLQKAEQQQLDDAATQLSKQMSKQTVQ
jgi:hypothetical protein